MAASSVHAVQEKNRTVRLACTAVLEAVAALASDCKLMIGPLPVTNSELIASMSMARKSASMTVRSLPRINVRSSRSREALSQGIAPGADNEIAIVGALRRPSNVNEHFWTVRLPERTSINRSGLSPGNSSAKAVRCTP
jgi:hypothetical protein